MQVTVEFCYIIWNMDVALVFCACCELERIVLCIKLEMLRCVIHGSSRKRCDLRTRFASLRVEMSHQITSFNATDRELQ